MRSDFYSQFPCIIISIIPLLPLSIQQKIASLVQQAHEARKKSKELLEVAKRAVEIAIEKSEDEALNYISETESKHRSF